MNALIQSKEDFQQFLKEKPDLKIATLGPIGTSCDHTLEVLADGLRQEEPKKVLLDNFEEVYAVLQSGDVDMAMVPSAYTNATKFYWSSEFQLAGTLVSKTPDYFYAVGRNQKSIDTIATCKPVEHLLDGELSSELPDSYDVLLANSTVESAKKVAEGKADACITNLNGLNHYQLTEVKRLSGVDMVWSFFRRGS